MKISEAVKVLLELQKDHGDIELVDPDGDPIYFNHMHTDEGFKRPVVVVDWDDGRR